MSDVTQILAKIRAGDRQASSELLPLVYDELRKLAMRRILIESARSRQCRQRQAPEVHLSSVDPVDGSVIDSPLRILELDDTLQKLEQEDPAVAELVRLRLYAGLSVADAAQAMGIGRSTAFEWWNYALAWFRVEMGGHEASG